MSAAIDDIEELWTTQRVAKLFEVTPETVRDWINAGSLRAVKINRSWRVPRSEVIRFANAKYPQGGQS